MRKNLRINPCVFPMPVMLVATYSDDEEPDIMTVTWGGICTKYFDKIVLNIDSFHRTAKNIVNRGAFTVAIPDASQREAVDYLGCVSADDVKDKVAKSGFHVIKSEFIDAPVIFELPVSIECRVIDIRRHDMLCVTGQIINVSADEQFLDDQGEFIPEKMNVLVYEQYQNKYFALGESLGNAVKFSHNQIK